MDYSNDKWRVITRSALQALNNLNTNNVKDAVASLNAFISQIEAQRGKDIPEERADLLIVRAQRIMSRLDTP